MAVDPSSLLVRSKGHQSATEGHQRGSGIIEVWPLAAEALED